MRFWGLNSKYTRKSVCANVCPFSIGKKEFGIVKLICRCFHWFPAAMLVSLRWILLIQRLHTKLYNFECGYILPNNSGTEYCIALRLEQVVYWSLFCNISISWLSLLNGKRFIFSMLRGVQPTMFSRGVTNQSIKQDLSFRCRPIFPRLWLNRFVTGPSDIMESTHCLQTKSAMHDNLNLNYYVQWTGSLISNNIVFLDYKLAWKQIWAKLYLRLDGLPVLCVPKFTLFF